MTLNLGVIYSTRLFLCCCIFALALVFASPSSWSQAMDHSAHQHHQMTVDPNGLVMNNNSDTLPKDCSQLGPDIAFTVYAGTEYAKDFPGNVFGLSQHEFRVAPCSRITVTFINKDQTRHQWMVHGLPKYLYPQGMFHLEAAGGKQRTGTFIVPSDDKTYLVHCDMAQHMEKGMKAQLVVGKGDGNLWSVPGVSDSFNGVTQQTSTNPIPRKALWMAAIATIAGLWITGFIVRGKARG